MQYGGPILHSFDDMPAPLPAKLRMIHNWLSQCMAAITQLRYCTITLLHNYFIALLHNYGVPNSVQKDKADSDNARETYRFEIAC